jgi:hypothetical protein
MSWIRNTAGTGVADLAPGVFYSLDLGSVSGMGGKTGSGIRNEYPGCYFRELRNNFIG